ncbi:MAG: biopolymer transporter Tol [Methylacidiphilales bacterium]|nr:biopolymer transporter Tol [Candidatus Methylacidiphilales bacterium]
MKSFSVTLTVLLVISLTSLLALRLHAQEGGVEVTVGNLPRVGVSISGGEATQVVSNDLRRTGMMTPVGGGTGEYLASGEASESGLTGRLTRGGSEIFNQTFSGSPRGAAHEFADAITKAITGLPGFSSSKIAFVSSATGSKELYLADIDGYNARAYTHDHVISASPSLNHDATKLVYASYKSGYLDIYLVDLTSNSRTRIVFFPGINSGPSFSPDGSQIAMTLSKDGNPEIYTMSLGGGTPVRITRTRGSETSPSWSPTGDRLVYSSDDHGSPQLFISSSSGVSEMDHLVTGNSFCTKPDWSPDGKLIAFTARVAGQFQIGVYDVASRNGHLVTTAGGQDPAWTCDSRHLVYSNDGRLYLLDTVTGHSLPIDVGLGGCGEPTVSR